MTHFTFVNCGNHSIPFLYSSTLTSQFYLDSKEITFNSQIQCFFELFWQFHIIDYTLSKYIWVIMFDSNITWLRGNLYNYYIEFCLKFGHKDWGILTGIVVKYRWSIIIFYFSLSTFYYITLYVHYQEKVEKCLSRLLLSALKQEIWKYPKHKTSLAKRRLIRSFGTQCWTGELINYK